MQLPSEYRADGNQQICGEDYLRYGQQSRFVEAIQAKIGTAVDTEDMEKQIAVLQGQLKQAFGTKSRLERQMDTLDINDAHYDRKILDLQRRYDEQYDT